MFGVRRFGTRSGGMAGNDGAVAEALESANEVVYVAYRD